MLAGVWGGCTKCPVGYTAAASGVWREHAPANIIGGTPWHATSIGSWHYDAAYDVPSTSRRVFNCRRLTCLARAGVIRRGGVVDRSTSAPPVGMCLPNFRFIEPKKKPYCSTNAKLLTKISCP